METVPRGRAPQPPRLLDLVRGAIRTRHYSRRTEKTYINWIRRYVFFHHVRHPLEMGAAEVTQFLTHLAVEGHVSAATQNQAFNALLFLYKRVLEKDIGPIQGVTRAKKPKRLPVVLNREEVKLIFAQLSGTLLLICRLLYGSGMRLFECLQMRVKDIDFTRHEVLVREGKGDKDRVVPLPASLTHRLREQIVEG